MPPIDLQAKFPSLRPVDKAPSMRLMNGCGTRVYGRRDYDAETKSYVTTLCFCLLFVPIIMIRAYRVIPSPRGGWYFLGTQPLSFLAKFFNGALAAAVVCTGLGIGAYMYTSRPEYIAHQRMVQAHKLAMQGQLAKAADVYVEFISAGKLEADNANAALKDLIDSDCQNSQGREAAGVYVDAAKVTVRPDAYNAVDLVSKGVETAGTLSTSNPRGALALLDVLRRMVVDPRPIDKARLPLLQNAVAADPGDMEMAVALATLLIEQDKDDQALKLMTPFKEKVGDGEGARVLGVLYTHQGKLDEALPLLQAYVKPRLVTLHTAESAYESALQAAYKHEIQVLNDKKGPTDFYSRYESATPDQQDALVDDYVMKRLKDNQQLQNQLEAAGSAQEVVPVVLELGMVMLDHAQEIPDPARRKEQLEAAKDVFLSIQGVAGGDDNYRLFLGQVYYWLGEQTQGKALFDAFLKSKSNSPEATLNLAGIYRLVGLDTQARDMGEDAYNRAANSRTRQEAAYLRSMVAKDNDDSIDWLRRSDVSDPTIAMTLDTALGDKAMEEGHEDEAAAQFKAALDISTTLPRNSTNLNQTSLICYSLYRSTGDLQYMNRAVDAIQQAVNMNQSDSILIFNAGMCLLDSAMADTVGHQMDFPTLRSVASLSTMQFLYRDEAGREAATAKLAAHPGVAKALALIEKTMVLSPKSTRGYEVACEVYSQLHQDAGLRSISQRLVQAGLDTSDATREVQEFNQGVKDAKLLVDNQASLKRLDDIMAAARKVGGPTLAQALCNEVSTLLTRDLLDNSTNADQVVRLAEEANAVAPSSGTSSTLYAAYLFRTFKQIGQTNPALAPLAKQYYRSLRHIRLLAYLVQQNDALGKAIASHPDFQKALEVIKADSRNFPNSATGHLWAIYSVLDPAQAVHQAKVLQDNPRIALSQAIQSRLSPASGGEALEAAWNAQALGHAQDARDILSKATAAGALIPQMR